MFICDAYMATVAVSFAELVFRDRLPHAMQLCREMLSL